MKSPFLKGLVAVVATGTTATGGFFAWKHATKPTDIKSRLIWEGLTIADVNRKGVWGAIYLAKKDVSGFSDFVAASDKATAATQLKQKCSELFGISASDKNFEESYKMAQKWCLKPDLTTIEMQFEFEDREFASGDDDFKNLFALNKGTSGFVEAVKTVVSGFTDKTELETAKGNVQSWCNAMKSKTPEGDNLRNAVSWCSKPESNFKSFMEKKGFRFLLDGEWGSKATSLKSKNGDSALDNDIKSESGNDDGSKLKSWCDKKKVDSAQIHTLSSDLGKIESRCFVRK
ncbi:hypothetical protein MHC_03810 [Mycoplasma haemocanis str. Illinois]|uniref:Uncharacterized protein n=1 Tax=Mycoplasma haemocanis (strain Illinois) TaxID=1111676 RepID=H6N7K0_MYCHN|nr:hypothetical protein [Mycoplasma haemocanis]AEW45622.1 hypothetical protein MHC_03810 [Mycoplasma haemocanis str. Illinois]